MINKLFVEFIGTFIFLSVILVSKSKEMVLTAIGIGMSLAIAIMFGGRVSGGHFNPAVSFMMYLNKAINEQELLGYILSQCVGGALALNFYNITN